MKPRADHRLATLLGVAALIAVLGGLISRLPGGGVATVTDGSGPSAPAAEGARREHVVDELFRQGTAMLHLNRYDLASVSLHRLLQLAPAMPEAHVNMGFAQFGLGRHTVAEDFFRIAIELRPGQRNAYYGLAIALEGQGKLAEAMGAMRTYLHLSPADDPHARKARSALWEWESVAAGAEESKVRDDER